jgi:hypothetical protein
MGSERIQDRIELYRFKESGGTFSGICTIIYDGDKAFIKGLHGSVGISDLKELRSYLSSVGINDVSFIRHGKLIKKKVA